MLDAMVGMARHACRQSHRRKCILVGTGIKKLRLKNVASRTNPRNRIDTRRRRAMTSVASGTSGRAQVSAKNKRVVMNAGCVVRCLRRRNAVALHGIGICVTSRARLRNVQGMHLGSLVARRLNIVHAVAIGAYGHFRVALREHLSVHAGLVLAELVGAQRRIEAAHVGGIGMALRANLGNLIATQMSAMPRV